MSSFKKLVATAPCRADLAGGTLDIWPLYLFHPGAVTVNFALSIRTRCEITPAPGSAGRSAGGNIGGNIVLRSLDTGREDRFPSVDALLHARRFRHPLAGFLCRYFLAAPGAPGGGFTLETHSDSPAGAGISGSSALMIATSGALAAWCGLRLGKEQLRVIAQNVEAQLIRVPTGCQDYYPALYGGVNAVVLSPGGIRRAPIDIPFSEIEQRIVLAYTGAPRQSGINNWEVFKAHIGGDKRVFRNFDEIADIAKSMHCALTGQEWDKVAVLIDRDWKLRKTNAPGITTPLIDKLISAAKKNGGLAAKVCGAGGGGCVLFLVAPGSYARVAKALAQNGGQVLPFRVSRQGLSIRRQL